MLRQGDQEGARLLSDIIRSGNRDIRAPTQLLQRSAYPPPTSRTTPNLPGFDMLPMQWSKPGAHLLLQTRTRTLDGTLRDLFTRWYPAMATNDNEAAISTAAA
jgi:hypothetical protein